MARYLPSGVENFRTLRASPKTLYIDKTALIAALIEDMDLHPHVFLARPRRFGKSLWLSTLRSLFLGARAFRRHMDRPGRALGLGAPAISRLVAEHGDTQRA